MDAGGSRPAPRRRPAIDCPPRLRIVVRIGKNADREPARCLDFGTDRPDESRKTGLVDDLEVRDIGFGVAEVSHDVLVVGSLHQQDPTGGRRWGHAAT